MEKGPKLHAAARDRRSSPCAGSNRDPIDRIRSLNSVSHVATLDCRLYDRLSRGAASPEAAR
jgi:hypothetical protein